MAEPAPLVSVVIPTFNNAHVIGHCLRSLRAQTYREIEVLVIDALSSDETVSIAQADAHVLSYSHSIPAEDGPRFGAPYQRNYGAAAAHGQYVCLIDADMELEGTVIEQCVQLCESRGADAVIIPEESFGVGYWAACKALERRCYRNDNVIEAPRFVKRSVWQAIGGLAPEMGADDWDLHARLKARGYTVGRVAATIRHNEGNLTLSRLARKRFVYGCSVLPYLRTHPPFDQLSLVVRRSYVRRWRSLAGYPLHAAGVGVMRTVEMAAAGAGVISALLALSRRR